MGVQIKNILEYTEISLDFLSGKKIAIDSFNMLYQFLSNIRQADGLSLTDSKGNITSHLKGLFNRCVYFKRNNIKAVFVFDGKAPKLKEKERENRQRKKMEADLKYKQALELGLVEDARKYAVGTSKLNTKMIDESKELISFFGFPVIDAPSEGEAQAAFFVKKQKVFAIASQDFDSLLLGGKFLIRNLSISRKRKMPGSNIFKDVEIEFFDLEKNLKRLNISLDELIIIAILVGTDFNPGGIKGIGSKKALKLVKDYRDRWDEMFKILMWHDFFSYTWIEVYNIFRKMPTNDIEFIFKKIDKDKIKNFLVNKDFDEFMITKSLNKIKDIKTLDNFF